MSDKSFHTTDTLELEPRRKVAIREAAPAPAPRAPQPPPPDEDDDEEPSFFQRYRIAIIIGAIVLIGLAVAIFSKPSGKSTATRRPDAPIVRIQLPPPPPPLPPPPPPRVQPPPQEKMIEQTPVAQPEEKPKSEPAKAKDEPPAPLGTNIKGSGPGIGLGSSGNGGGVGSGTGESGSRWGYYAGQVQSKVSDAMRNNRKTRNAALSVKVKIWPSATGRVTRAELVGSSGDPAVDAAIQSEVLNGLQLQEPPPAGMPLPIVMRLTARRP